MKDTVFSSKLQFNARGILQSYPRPIVMGIINATPDSFYAGSRVSNVEKALKQATQMINEGAAILDIGGYSSRPGAAEVTEKEEIERVVPVIEAIHAQFPNQLISVDTFRGNVAQKALEAGAQIINDITAGQLDMGIFDVAAHYNAPYIMMHFRGTPQTMMTFTVYENVIKEIQFYFSERIALAKKAGIKDIFIDPGFGFSKTTDQNYELLGKVSDLKLLDCPILVGVSRKSMIYKTLGTTAAESLNGTSVLNTVALLQGAKILRVHDVKPAVEAIQLIEKSGMLPA